MTKPRAGSSQPRASGPSECPPASSEQLTLDMLPHDVLRLFLLQEGIGAAELCSLECTAWVFKQLVDEEAWRHAFLQRRRCNVLREPAGWKQELSRREMWSRDWRQIVGCGSPAQARLGLPTQKLRRFAQKMLYGGCEGASAVTSAGPRPRTYDTHIVDKTGATPQCFTTISAALAQAKPYDIVLVEPGEYHEKLKLDRHAQVLGRGPPGSVTVVGVDGPAVEAMGRTASRVANVTIKQMARAGGGAMSGAVLIKGGAVVLIEESQISSDVGHCIVIQGMDSCGYVLHNAITNGRGVGVLVCDNGRGVVEDNDISFNGRAGVAILSGGDPLVCRNKIHEGMDSGVLVSEKGRGRVEDNDIFQNRRAGVAIFKVRRRRPPLAPPIRHAPLTLYPHPLTPTIPTPFLARRPSGAPRPPPLLHPHRGPHPAPPPSDCYRRAPPWSSTTESTTAATRASSSAKTAR